MSVLVLFVCRCCQQSALANLQETSHLEMWYLILRARHKPSHPANRRHNANAKLEGGSEGVSVILSFMRINWP
jgi:hypothetical protein